MYTSWTLVFGDFLCLFIVNIANTPRFVVMVVMRVDFLILFSPVRYHQHYFAGYILFSLPTNF